MKSKHQLPRAINLPVDRQLKKIQKELDFLHKQRIDRLTTEIPLKSGDTIKLVTEVDYDTGTIITQRCNILKRIWLWLKRVFHVLMS